MNLTVAEPVRLGLVSSTPIPTSYLGHAFGFLRDRARRVELRDIPADGFYAAALTCETDEDPSAWRTDLVSAAHALGIDAALIRGDLTVKGPGLVVTDVDSTFIQQEVIELLAHHAGSGEAVAEITERAMRGELDFEASLRERVATLKGLPIDTIETVIDSVRLTQGADGLVAWAHKIGASVGLVSGGFHPVLDPIAHRHGVDHWVANGLGHDGSTFDGTLVGEIIDREAKARYVSAWAHEAGVPLSRVICVGDGANDLDMMAIAGLGIAFCAKPIVRSQADATVSFPRLDAVAAFFA